MIDRNFEVEKVSYWSASLQPEYHILKSVAIAILVYVGCRMISYGHFSSLLITGKQVNKLEKAFDLFLLNHL